MKYTGEGPYSNGGMALPLYTPLFGGLINVHVKYGTVACQINVHVKYDTVLDPMPLTQ